MNNSLSCKHVADIFNVNFIKTGFTLPAMPGQYFVSLKPTPATQLKPLSLSPRAQS